MLRVVFIHDDEATKGQYGDPHSSFDTEALEAAVQECAAEYPDCRVFVERLESVDDETSEWVEEPLVTSVEPSTSPRNR